MRYQKGTAGYGGIVYRRNADDNIVTRYDIKLIPTGPWTTVYLLTHSELNLVTESLISLIHMCTLMPTMVETLILDAL